MNTAMLPRCSDVPYSRVPCLSVEQTLAATNPDAATAQTVARMKSMIASSVNDPSVGWACEGAKRMSQDSSPRGLCIGVWQWVKNHVQLAEDSELVRKLLGRDPTQLDLLIEPRVLLRSSPMQGDCATFTMLACAMLQRLGLQPEIVACAVNPNEPTIFSHAYSEVTLPDGSRFPMDASHGQYPGWEVPMSRQFRRQTWGLDVPLSTAPSAPAYKGLHGFTANVRPQYRKMLRRRRANRGMGACVGGYDATTNEVCFDSPPDMTPVVPQYTPVPLTPGPVPPLGTPFPTGAWASFIGNIGNQLTRLFGPQPSVIPGSNLVYDPATGRYLPATGAGLQLTGGGLNIGGSGIGSILLWGGLAFAGITLLGNLGKK